MTYHYELFSQDFSETLLATTDKAEVEKFLRDGGHDWLPIRVEWGGRTWKERWSGRIELMWNGSTIMQNESAYLRYLTTWPNPLEGSNEVQGLPVSGGVPGH